MSAGGSPAEQLEYEFAERIPGAVSPPATAAWDGALAREIPAAGADGFVALSWDPLARWVYEPDVTEIPRELREALQGKRVRLEGHIFPVVESDPQEFVLMRQGWQCCLGRPPQINEVVRVIMPPERRTELPPVPVVVEAEDFRVEEVREDGFVLEIYTMRLISLRPRE